MAFDGTRNQGKISVMDIKGNTGFGDQRQGQGSPQMGPELLNPHKKRAGIIKLGMIQGDPK